MNKAKKGWEKWKEFGRKAASVQAQILFTLFYFLILWIVGIAFRLVSDPLNIKNKKIKSTFTKWNYPDETLEQARNPY